MAEAMPKLFILYSGPQGKHVERLSSELSRYAFIVESGTQLDTPYAYQAIIAVSTANAWALARFRHEARKAFSSNRLMLVRFVRFATVKPHPYSQIIENSLAQWEGDDDVDWQALLKRLGLLSGRPGLEQLARIRSRRNHKRHAELEAWANTYKHDPIAERVKAELIGPSFAPSTERTKSVLKIGLAIALGGAIIGFSWQTYRIQKISYSEAAQNAWSRVNKNDIDAMRAFHKSYRYSDQAELSRYLIMEKEAELWKQTQTTNTIEAYDTYLRRFPPKLSPPPQFIDAAKANRLSIIKTRQAVFERLQIGLRALGMVQDIRPTSQATPELLEALSTYYTEDKETPQIDDWEIATLDEIETLAARIKVFGRRQLLAYKSHRWADLETQPYKPIKDLITSIPHEGRFKGTNSATLYFSPGKYELSIENQLLLWELVGSGEFLDIIVTGHDDSMRPRLASFRLAERRAANVRNALTYFGADPALISVKSWGATRPVINLEPNSPAQLNRRVEITFLAR